MLAPSRDGNSSEEGRAQGSGSTRVSLLARRNAALLSAWPRFGVYQLSTSSAIRLASSPSGLSRDPEPARRLQQHPEKARSHDSRHLHFLLSSFFAAFRKALVLADRHSAAQRAKRAEVQLARELRRKGRGSAIYVTFDRTRISDLKKIATTESLPRL